MSGFPNSNMEMAIKDGTNETKEKLREIGFKIISQVETDIENIW